MKHCEKTVEELVDKVAVETAEPWDENRNLAEPFVRMVAYNSSNWLCD